MKRATPRQQKIADSYDTDIWPLVPGRAGNLILRALPRRPATVAFEAGCASGRLALAIADRLDDDSRILAVDPSPALIDLAESAKKRHSAGGKVSFHLADLTPPLPVDDGAYDLAVSNLVLAESDDPRAAVADLARCLKPGGRVMITAALNGSWGEPLDLYGDVLTEQGKWGSLTALHAYRGTLPTPQAAVGWLESAGFTDVGIDVDRWELLFKSAREFFFAPVVEQGPLPIWKRIAGGHGDEMQDVFFFVKEAIDTYFSGSIFPVTMAIGCLGGTKPTPGPPG
jgi:SAM-dependent methyltransferase